MRKFLTILVVMTAAVAGCTPKGDVVGAKVLSEAKVEKLVEANVDKLIEAKVADKIEATAEAKVADHIGKVEAKLLETLDNRVTQSVRDFQGKQNIGMFAGDSIYILILAIVVILAVAGVVVYMIWHRGKRQKLMVAALTAGVSKARNAGNGEESAGIESVLSSIQKHADKAGVGYDLNCLLVKNGLL